MLATRHDWKDTEVTPKLTEYRRWMTRYSELIESILARRAAPTALGEALDALLRALAALEDPTTLEERRTLVYALIDYSNMFNGQIEGHESDARQRLRARERAFEVAASLQLDDPVRAEASVRLGIALLDTGSARAAELIRDGLRVMEATPGARQPWLINARENLGLALLRLERWSEAAAALDDARRAWLALPPDAAPGQPTGSLFFNLGLAWQRLGRWSESRDVLREAVARNLTSFGEEHPNTVEAELYYAIALVELGAREEARPILERTADVVRAKAGESHRYYKLATEHIARLGA